MAVVGTLTTVASRDEMALFPAKENEKYEEPEMAGRA